MIGCVTPGRVRSPGEVLETVQRAGLEATTIPFAAAPGRVVGQTFLSAAGESLIHHAIMPYGRTCRKVSTRVPGTNSPLDRA